LASIKAATVFSFLSEYYKHILVKDQWNKLAVSGLSALYLHYFAAFSSYTQRFSVRSLPALGFFFSLLVSIVHWDRTGTCLWNTVVINRVAFAASVQIIC